MSSIGVCECFFGPTWTMDERKSWAAFMGRHEMGFYIYGPKADPFLRKRWQEPWTPDYQQSLKTIVNVFQQNKVKAGVALSPFGLRSVKEGGAREALIEKVETLSALGFDYVGLFFDDMNYEEGLLDLQLEVLELSRRHSQAKLIFCPTYYSFDPILDKVFGQRPPDYVEQVGKSVHESIDICWTGPKVISPEISEAHLLEVTQLLKRKPFLFDNYFANDGPKNCKFLKLKPLAGRAEKLAQNISGLVFNPMNQSYLSQIVVLAANRVLIGNEEPMAALREAVTEMCPSGVADLVLNNRELFLSKGLDFISDKQKSEMLQQLTMAESTTVEELTKWLTGGYTVGSECLTD